MKLRVTLNKGGMEKVAKGAIGDLYSWDFDTNCWENRSERATKDAEDAPEHLAFVEVTFPSRESVIPTVIEGLENELRIHRLEAHKGEIEILERKNAVLMLEAPREVANSEVVDDIPF